MKGLEREQINELIRMGKKIQEEQQKAPNQEEQPRVEEVKVNEEEKRLEEEKNKLESQKGICCCCWITIYFISEQSAKHLEEQSQKHEEQSRKQQPVHEPHEKLGTKKANHSATTGGKIPPRPSQLVR